jgi:hypothetical protein
MLGRLGGYARRLQQYVNIVYRPVPLLLCLHSIATHDNHYAIANFV